MYTGKGNTMNTIRQFLRSLRSETYEDKLRNYKMSTIIFNTMKFLSFLVLTYVSLNLSMDLFKEFGSTQKDTNFFVLTILGLELSKIISLVLAKSEFYTRKLKNVLIGVGFSILFIGLGFVSVFSSYGFVLVATEKTAVSNVAMSTEADIAFYQGKLDIINQKIESYLPQLQRSDLALSSKDKIEKQLQAWDLEKEEYYTQIRNLQKQSFEQESGKESVGMFSLMARDMNIDEKKLRFWMMFILVLVIELCITVMSPHISIVKPNKEDFKDNIPVSYLEVPVSHPTIPVPVMNEVPVERKVIEEPKNNEESLLEELPVIEIDPFEVQEAPIESIPMEEPIATVVIRETAFEKFVKALYNNGKYTWLKDKVNIANEIGISQLKAQQYHSLLATIKGASGYPLIEFRRSTGKWYPNYTDQIILNLYKEGTLKVEELDAPKA